jgi:hypothetical protein
VSTAGVLLDHYGAIVDWNFVDAYAQACLMHSTSTKLSNSIAGVSKMSQEEMQFVHALDPDTTHDMLLSKEAIRSIEAFIDDLCVAYSEYGAIYPFFTRCLRFFLLPAFPSKIRCELVRRLNGLLHLLTLPDDGDLSSLLEKSLLGGLPAVDGSVRDPPEILDSMVDVLRSGKICESVDFDYVSSLAVALLARNLAISLQADSTGMVATRRRIQSLEVKTIASVLDATTLFLSKEGTSKDLVEASLHACDKKRTSELRSDLISNGLDNDFWDRFVSMQRQ